MTVARGKRHFLGASLLAFACLIACRAGSAWADSTPAARAEFFVEPTAGEIQRVRVLEELIVPMGSTSPNAEENQLLATALMSAQKSRVATGAADIALLEQFAQRFPQSAWRPALLTNLGLEYYRRGSFSKALDAWQRAWDLGKSATDPQPAAVVNRAVAELAKMHARLGQMSDLERIFAEIGNRPMSGSPAETIAHTRDALSNMKTRPEISFRCGPSALDGIIALRNPADPSRAMLREVASTTDGTSLALLVELAAKCKLSAQAVRRDGAVSIPVPAVVHWKLGHYGALLRHEGDRYLLQDPTFGNTQWIRQTVIDEESSGYFLLTGVGSDLPRGWQAIPAKEAASVWGKGNTTSSNPNGTGPNNPTPAPPPNECPGMAVWTVHLMLTSLNLRDTPLSYLPPVGPAIAFSLNYDMREVNQPATFNFSNFGNRWNFNYASTLTFDTNNAYLRSGAGGTQEFTNFDSASAAYPVFSSRDVQTRSIVVRQAATVYQQQFPDGSINVFELVDGSGRAYQTKFIDPQGNMIQFGYDGLFRLTTITDAIGQITKLAYTFPSDTLKVTKITDPFGRTAQFSYNVAGQLTRITDAVGLTSDFTYGAADAVLTLVTGYGTTSFSFTDSGNNQRVLLVTLPAGSREKFESSTAAGYPTSDPVAPQGMPVLNQYHEFRNTFHWDRKAMEEAPNDYTKATVYHFMHSIDNAATGLLLESVKRPLENREWYFYHGQSVLFPGFMNAGILDRKTLIGRVLDDGTTQLTQNLYDAVGNLTQTTDPVGRTRVYFYDANGIDLLAVRQVTSSATSELLASFIYTPTHLPLTSTDAAGQTTSYTYNSYGEVLTVVNPKSEITTYTYNANGYLLSVAGPSAPTTGQTSLTYDSVGRIQTLTDALGYTITFGYDNLDRPTTQTFPDLTNSTLIYTLLDVTKSTDRLNRDTNYSYNSLRQLVRVSDPLNQVTQYAYCRCGALSSLTDSLGRVTTWEYDLQSRKTAKVYADDSRTTYFYEATSSRLQSVIDARGQVVSYEYNLDDRLKSLSYSNATSLTPSVYLAYDRTYPRITSLVDGTGTTSFEYHPVGPGQVRGAGLLSSRSNALGPIQFNYDELGRLVQRTVNGVPESFDYDGLNRISTVGNALGLFTFGYVNNSGLHNFTQFPNGQSTVFTYFNNTQDHRLRQLQHFRAGGGNLSLWSYAYNAEGQITSWSQQRDNFPARVITPSYDATQQLTGAAITNPTASFAYVYDAVGNRLSERVNGATTTVAFNPLNEVVSAAPPSQSDRTYEWDAEQRMTAINLTASNERTEIAYDGLGRRVRITEKAGSTVTSIKQFLWDDFRIVAEFDAEGILTKRFFRQGVQTLSGATPGIYFYATDHLGSVRELTDEAGTARAHYDYDPFGRRTKTSGDLDADFGFTSHYFHAPSGLSLAPFRAYDPNLGRWLSRDPLEELNDGINLFTYVRNQPIDRVDFSGLRSEKDRLRLLDLRGQEYQFEGLLGPLVTRRSKATAQIRAYRDGLDMLRYNFEQIKCPNKKQRDEYAADIDRVTEELKETYRELNAAEKEFKRINGLLKPIYAEIGTLENQ